MVNSTIFQRINPLQGNWERGWAIYTCNLCYKIQEMSLPTLMQQGIFRTNGHFWGVGVYTLFTITGSHFSCNSGGLPHLRSRLPSRVLSHTCFERFFVAARRLPRGSLGLWPSMPTRGQPPWNLQMLMSKVMSGLGSPPRACAGPSPIQAST